MTKATIKSDKDLEVMAKGGKILGEIRGKIAGMVKVGMTTQQLDEMADKLIKMAGGEASFKEVPGYHYATCICVNEEVVHGMPGKRKLAVGDVVGIDVGMKWNGYHTDTSTTVVVANPKSEIRNPKIKRFLEVGRRALREAIGQVRVGNRVWDVSQAMQKVVETNGYSVVRALTGHGIGRQLHEEPAIPCFAVGVRLNSPKLAAGMVIAVEVMYNMGTSDVVYKNDDGWTIATADGKISGLFEETVAVTKTGPKVLTGHYE